MFQYKIQIKQLGCYTDAMHDNSNPYTTAATQHLLMIFGYTAQTSYQANFMCYNIGNSSLLPWQFHKDSESNNLLACCLYYWQHLSLMKRYNIWFPVITSPSRSMETLSNSSIIYVN